MTDPVIRKILRETALSKYYLDNDSKVVDEFVLPVAKARIDIAVINGHLHGFEIKSASDTLQRLPHQIEAYSKVFDYITIITEAKYTEKIIRIIPEWVGVLECGCKENGKTIKKIRTPRFNSNKQGFFLAKLLWKNELVDILKELGIKHKSTDRSWVLCEIIAENLKTPDLSRIVRGKLKERKSWRDDIIEYCAIK